MISIELYHDYPWSRDLETKMSSVAKPEKFEFFSVDQAPEVVMELLVDSAGEWARRACSLEKKIGVRSKDETIEYCLLYDDYFGVLGPDTWSERLDPYLPDLLQEACKLEGIENLTVVRESSMVTPSLELLRALSTNSDFGAGTMAGTPHDSEESALWMTNGVTGGVFSADGEDPVWDRLDSVLDVADEPALPNIRSAGTQPDRGRHALRIEYEVFESRRNPKTPLSCALLAATWQLARLGVISNALPRGFAVAEESISYLPGDYLGIETVVRMIIGSNDFRGLDGFDVERLDQLGGPDGVLSRIRYIFAE